MATRSFSLTASMCEWFAETRCLDLDPEELFGVDEKRLGTAIEQTHDGMTVRLGAGARLVRLGPSTVVVAEPDPGDDNNLAELAVKGSTTITCVCNSSGRCVLILSPTGDNSVLLKCDGATCDGNCSKVTVDSKLWDSPLVSHLIRDTFGGDPNIEGGRPERDR